MDTLAIIEGKGVCIVKWCKDHKAAGDFLADWLRDNSETRPYVRTTIAKSVFVIEG